MFDALAASRSLENVRLFMLPVRRDQQRDVAADDFACGIPKHPFRAAVPRGDDAAKRLADDCISRRLDNRGQLGLHLLRLLALADVAHDAGKDPAFAQERLADG